MDGRIVPQNKKTRQLGSSSIAATSPKRSWYEARASSISFCDEFCHRIALRRETSSCAQQTPRQFTPVADDPDKTVISVSRRA